MLISYIYYYNLLIKNENNKNQEGAMGIFDRLGLADRADATIDWDITPALTFTIFESWGTQEKTVRNSNEKYYYFYIDNWQKPAKVCLMERGIKHAKVIAKIKAPQELVDRSVLEQGETIGLDRCYAVNDELKKWLNEHIVLGDSNESVEPVIANDEAEEIETDLPGLNDPVPDLTRITLPSTPVELVEEDIPQLVKNHGFFDTKYNVKGQFKTHLVDNNDELTVN